jgi:hypothetical protein
MAGNTARIDERVLRVQWGEYVPMVAICEYWSITKDQLVRLRDVWSLPLRLDRRRRFKPRGDDKWESPDADEVAASETSLNLAPRVAAAATVIQSGWDEKARTDRAVCKPAAFSLARIELYGETRQFVDSLNKEVDL